MTEKRLGPPPVETLSDVAWARVERNVLLRTTGTITQAASAREIKNESKRSAWLWLAVPAAAAAAFAFAFFSMNGPSSPPGEEQPSRFVAGSAPSSVSFGDAHITLDANSAVLLDQKGGKPSAVLERGALVVAVSAPFTVLAGDTIIRTTNTKVRVSRDGERAFVRVESGAVDIRYHGHDVKLPANHAWSSDRPTHVVDQNVRENDIQIEH